VLLLFQL
jgi:hypothetical protein